MLNASQAVEQVHRMVEWRDRERTRLKRIHGYLRGTQQHVWLSTTVPPEVRRMADISRVNVVKLVVDSVVQSLYVDGFRAPKANTDVPAWDLWQRNRMDSRQMGIHRAASAYGAGYLTVLPGDPVPVMRGVSPRNMTAVYGEDPDWPIWVLEKRETDVGSLWRLFDDEAVYWVGEEPVDNAGTTQMTFLSSEVHGAGVCPVVRFPDVEDLDDTVRGEVEPLIPVQDQIDLTTFSLLVAQHYGAFRQRYVIGWLAESETEKLKASASQLWTFEDSPEDVKVGEFEQTDLKGYLDSREASLRHLAIMSQTPVNELVGTLVNLGAEALVAARDARNRKLDERKTVRGERWEQALDLGGSYVGLEPDPGAWVRWRDTEARALSATADALGKFAEMLGIPKQALWERAADALGASQDEVEDWNRMAEQADPFAQLNGMLQEQAGG